MGSNTNFVCIRGAPSTWNSGVVRGMFSKYGRIEDISIQPNTNSRPPTSFVTVEFECMDGAEAAVDDNRNSEHKVTFYRPLDTSSSGSFVIFNSTPKERPPIQAFPCNNENCTKQIIIEGPSSSDNFLMENMERSHYCSYECYTEYLELETNGVFDARWAEFISNMGRNGIGMLKDPKKLDKIEVTVDAEGFRMVSINNGYNEH